ncbi:MAG: hypothetical protein R3C11_18685 [Planctomycetaceae bacterium]
MNASPAPESRTYRHVVCGEVTFVSGDSFESISDPLFDMQRTWCSYCNKMCPIAEYEWVDTGEKITDYYKRHTAKATRLELLSAPVMSS